MKKALVTGASGFIGANLVRRLLEAKHEVHAFVRPSSQLWRLKDVEDQCTIHKVDMADRSRIGQYVNTIRPDWIFHLAANGAYSWQSDVFEIMTANVIGTCNLIEACLQSGFEALVNTGSSSEYGFKDHPASEEEALKPNSYYAVAKAAQTMYCRHVAESQRVNINTLRLYSVYGPFEDPRRLIPTLITKGLDGKLPALVDPCIARDYIYVDDVVNAYFLATENPKGEFGAIYNVGTGKQTSIKEIVEVARQLLKIKDEPRWSSMENRIWDTGCWVSDPNKLISKLGFHPQFSVVDGLKATVDWLKNHPLMLHLYRQSALLQQEPGALSLRPTSDQPC